MSRRSPAGPAVWPTVYPLSRGMRPPSSLSGQGSAVICDLDHTPSLYAYCSEVEVPLSRSMNTSASLHTSSLSSGPKPEAGSATSARKSAVSCVNGPL